MLFMRLWWCDNVGSFWDYMGIYDWIIRIGDFLSVFMEIYEDKYSVECKDIIFVLN